MKTKQTSIIIESVDNGFIVTENFSLDSHFRGEIQRRTKKVFNTHRQLNKYINENLILMVDETFKND